MFKNCLVIVSIAIIPVLCLPREKLFITEDHRYPFPFVTREQWGARPPLSVTPLASPVPSVVIHHSYIPGACNSSQACCQAMRSMQDYHQLTNLWNDIGYNFAVGGDRSVYEGRGWTAVGAHAKGFNNASIGIVLIGDWIAHPPPQFMLRLTKELISAGVARGLVSADYQLVGHRQLASTECPGQALYDEIETWSHA